MADAHPPEHMSEHKPAAPPPLFEPTPKTDHIPRRRVLLELDFASLLYLGLGVLGAWLILALFRAATDFMAAIAVGSVLALALDQPVSRLQARLGLPRAASVGLVCLTLVVAIVGLVVFLSPAAIDQATEFGDELPETVEDMYSLPIVGERLEEADASQQVTEWVDELPANTSSEAVTDLVTRLIGGMTTALAVVIVAFAVLFDGQLIISRIRRTIPSHHRSTADWLGGVFYRTFGRYFAGSLLVAIMAGLYVLTVGLILGVPLAPVVGIWVMTTNLIPQVGGLLGGSLFVLLAVTVSVTTGLIALVLFLIYQSTENYLIQPSIVGGAVQLSPPATMIAVLVGGVSAGVPGALLAVPLVATAKAAYTELRWGHQDPRQDHGLPRDQPVTQATT